MTVVPKRQSEKKRQTFLIVDPVVSLMSHRVPTVKNQGRWAGLAYSKRTPIFICFQVFLFCPSSRLIEDIQVNTYSFFSALFAVFGSSSSTPVGGWPCSRLLFANSQYFMHKFLLEQKQVCHYIGHLFSAQQLNGDFVLLYLRPPLNPNRENNDVWGKPHILSCRHSVGKKKVKSEIHWRSIFYNGNNVDLADEK